jgi:hypothetical protein
MTRASQPPPVPPRPPPRPMPPTSPLLRRLPPGATFEDMSRAYADALLFITQTMPGFLQRANETLERAVVVTSVADEVSQRAASAAQGLELAVHEVQRTQQTLNRQLDEVQLAIARAEQLYRTGHELGLAPPASLPEHRGRSPSKSEIVEAVQEGVAEVLEGGTRAVRETPSDRAREVYREMANAEKVAVWDKRTTWIAGIAAAVIAALIMLVVGLLLGKAGVSVPH